VAERVAQTIKTMLKKQGLWPEAMRWAALGVWAEAVGERVAARAKPTGVSAQSLLVTVESPAWRQELSLLKPAILRRLNSLLGGDYLKDIRFSGRATRPGTEPGEEGPQRAGWQPPYDIRAAQLEETEWERIKALLPDGQDDSTREALQRLLITVAKRNRLLSANGSAACPMCGAAGAGGLCPCCRMEQKRRNEAKAVSLLSEVPWLDTRGLKEIDPSLGEEEYLTARDILLAAWSKEVRDLRSRRSKSSQESLRLARVKLAMLLTNTPPESLTEEAVDRAVPDRRGARART
jgi:hypothetical protein